MENPGLEVWRGGVNTWECDRMGHLNVRFHVAHAAEGLVGLAAGLGLPRAFAPAAWPRRSGGRIGVDREQARANARDGFVALGELVIFPQFATDPHA